MAITKATASSIAPAAKGNLVVGSATNDAAVLAVGANGTILTADSAEATGVKWAAAGGGGANWSLLNAGGTALTGAATITVSGISGKDKIMILFKNASSASASAEICVRLNTDTANNYYIFANRTTAGSTYSAANAVNAEGGSSQDRLIFGAMSSNASSVATGFLQLSGCNSSGLKIFTFGAGFSDGGANGQFRQSGGGYYDSSSTISSISMFSTPGNFDNGTVYVYTSA
jgi:hypothetical protein